MDTWWTERPRASWRSRLGLGTPEPVGGGAPRFLPLAPPRLARAGATESRPPVPHAGRTLTDTLEYTAAACLAVRSGRRHPTGTIDLARAVLGEPPVASGGGVWSVLGGAAGPQPVRRPYVAPTSQELLQRMLAVRLLHLLQPPLTSYLDRRAVIEWPREFFAYQRDGIRALVEREVLLLADDTGLGKTVQAVAALRILVHLRRFRPIAYTGDLTPRERDQAIADFKERPDSRALILSLRAGGQGLNLQEASYVFHFDRWWNPATERQAEDRAHRLGQASPVTVYKYICEGTLEERIDEVLRRKQALFDQLVDDVSIDLARHLTQHELFGLFGLSAPGS